MLITKRYIIRIDSIYGFQDKDIEFEKVIFLGGWFMHHLEKCNKTIATSRD